LLGSHATQHGLATRESFMEKPIVARRALLHPLWIGALALLVINDHRLKGSGLLPGLVTGKLSDLAGMIVAPLLLATILRLSSRRALLAAHVATGVGFAAIKLLPAAAHALESLTALGPIPWHITVDPTDLIALPMLLVSWRVLLPATQRPVPERPALQRAAAAAGAIACAATSQEPPPSCGDFAACGTVTPRESASLVIGNGTDAERLFRVRPLKDGLEVNCSAVLADPTHTLSRESFGPAQTWLIQPQRGLPLQVGPDCSAYLVDADGLAPTLLAWSAAQFPTGVLSTSTTDPDPNRMISLTLELSTGKLVLADHPAVFEAPPVEPVAPTPACAPSDPGTGVEWSQSPKQDGVLTEVTTSPDGCHGLRFANETFYVCVPPEAMPFKAGDSVEVRTFNIMGGSYPEAATVPMGDGVMLQGDTQILLVTRGNVLAHHDMAGLPEPLTEPTVSADLVAGCTGAHDECGGYALPMSVSFLGDHVKGVEVLRAGGKLALADGYGTLFVIRAESMPVRDTKCPPFPVAERHFESALLVPVGP
jgi:hypothetical protein